MEPEPIDKLDQIDAGLTANATILDAAIGAVLDAFRAGHDAGYRQGCDDGYAAGLDAASSGTGGAQ